MLRNKIQYEKGMHFKIIYTLVKTRFIYLITPCMPIFCFLVLKQLVTEIYVDFQCFLNADLPLVS